MTTVHLRDFLATGEFGPISLGADRPAVEACFGQPETTGGQSRKHKRPNIWKYGDVEFFFERDSGELHLVHIDHFSGDGGAPEGWGELRLEPWVVREGLSRDVFEQTLASAGLPYTVVPQPSLNQCLVSVPAGVVVGFIAAPDEFCGPVGLAFVSRTHRPTK